MISRERKILMKKYGGLYRRVSGVDLEVCVYCGDPRQCLDHVPAISLLNGIDAKKYMKKGGRFLLYPSCLECNKVLSNFSGIDYYERLMYLQEKYDIKSSKYEIWSDDELKELGYSLRSLVRKCTNKGKYYSDKLYKVSAMIDRFLLNEIIL